MFGEARTEILDIGQRRQSLIIGGILLLMAVFVAAIFGIGSSGVATFRLSRPGDAIVIGSIVLAASPYAFFVAAALAFLGVRQLVRGDARRLNLVLGIVLILFVTAFLTWATAGKSFSLTGMLQSTVVRALPIALGGLAGVLSERVAVINIAIEGMLLSGAFAGAVAGSLFGSWIGLASAVAVGGLFGLLLAVLVVTYRVDQIVAGIAINIFVLGLTSYSTSQILSANRHLNDAPIFRAIRIPASASFPSSGRSSFSRTFSFTERSSSSPSLPTTYSTRAPACGRAPWASTRGRPTRSASTSIRCATST